MDKRFYAIIAILISCVLAVVLSFNDIIKNDYEYSEDELEVLEKADKKGFVIENEILIAYYGDKKEVTIPEEVRIISSNAFAADFNRGVNLEKITIPGTVEILEPYALTFTNAKIVNIEEGVKEIGDHAFSDAYIEQISFPNSIENIGFGTLDTQIGNNPEILCDRQSFACHFYETDPPYGSEKWNEQN